MANTFEEPQGEFAKRVSLSIDALNGRQLDAALTSETFFKDLVEFLLLNRQTGPMLVKALIEEPLVANVAMVNATYPISTLAVLAHKVHEMENTHPNHQIRNKDNTSEDDASSSYAEVEKDNFPKVYAKL
jgi:hypothetical protein